jgi:hypothetical protein
MMSLMKRWAAETWAWYVEVNGVDLNKPKYASMDPITVKLCEDVEESLKQDSVDVTFLENGFLELRVPENLLGGEGYKEVYFAGIHSQDRKAVKREAEEFDGEWRNDKYTGCLHPDNNKRFKFALEEYGVSGKMEDFSSSSENATATEDVEDDEDEEKKLRTAAIT